MFTEPKENEKAAKDDKKGKGDKTIEEGRRNFLKGAVTAGAGIAATDFPERRFALQAVGRRVEIMELGEWGERTPQSRLVAIGSSFDAQELSRRFDACLTKS